MKNMKLFLVAAVGMLTVGCYNRFDTPAPAKIWTEEEVQDMGLTQISIRALKQQFIARWGSLDNTGSNTSWGDTKTLKCGPAANDIEALFENDPQNLIGNPQNMKFWDEAANYYIKGKVISSDAQGNVYKSLYIDDGTGAIELKLCGTLYTIYKLDLSRMDTQWVYVKLDGLYLGNYRMMLSLGDAPSNALNAGLSDRFYANSNFETPLLWRNMDVGKYNRVLPGKPDQLTEASIDSPGDANIIAVNSSNYSKLNQDYYGRLIRFEGVKIRYAGVTFQNLDTDADGQPQLNPVYEKFIEDGGKPVFARNGAVSYYDEQGNLVELLDENGKAVYEYLWKDADPAPSLGDTPYPNFVVTDTGSPVFYEWYRWAYSVNSTGLYGAVLMTLNPSPTSTANAGVYSIRTSGFARFAMKPIPADGTVGNVLGIYSIYSKSSTYSFAQYQITVNRIEDLDFPEESLLTEAWIDHNTPERSYDPEVKNGAGMYDDN